MIVGFRSNFFGPLFRLVNPSKVLLVTYRKKENEQVANALQFIENTLKVLDVKYTVLDLDSLEPKRCVAFIRASLRELAENGYTIYIGVGSGLRALLLYTLAAAHTLGTGTIKLVVFMEGELKHIATLDLRTMFHAPLEPLTPEEEAVLWALEELGGEARLADIAERAGLTKPTTVKKLKKLVGKNYAEKISHGRYRITDEGTLYLNKID